jgi:hypothetical protein
LPPGHMAGTHRQKLGQPHFGSRTKQTAPLKSPAAAVRIPPGPALP